MPQYFATSRHPSKFRLIREKWLEVINAQTIMKNIHSELLTCIFLFMSRMSEIQQLASIADIPHFLMIFCPAWWCDGNKSQVSVNVIDLDIRQMKSEWLLNET